MCRLDRRCTIRLTEIDPDRCVNTCQGLTQTTGEPAGGLKLLYRPRWLSPGVFSQRKDKIMEFPGDSSDRTAESGFIFFKTHSVLISLDMTRYFEDRDNPDRETDLSVFHIFNGN